MDYRKILLTADGLGLLAKQEALEQLFSERATLENHLAYMVNNIGNPMSLETRERFIAAREVVATDLINDPANARVGGVEVTHPEGEIHNYEDLHHAVYSQDNPRTAPFGWIQWKGTDVCIDLHCQCGYHGHYDGDFLYYYQCPKCKAMYAVGAVIKLIPLTEKQQLYVHRMGHNVKTVPLDEE